MEYPCAGLSPAQRAALNWRFSEIQTVLFTRWFDAVETTLKPDHMGWGLSDRYEGNAKALSSHETMIAEGQNKGGFSMTQRRSYSVIDQPTWRPDGIVTHPDVSGASLWYELKSVFVPHYKTASDWHNDDYARLLRIEHPNGALRDVDRLRKIPNAERVFLLMALPWCTENHIDLLKEYERHRDVLIDAFQSLARLPVPTREFTVNGTDKPWSCRVMAWLL